MKLLVEIDAPDWAAPGSPRVEQHRCSTLGIALKAVADTIANCGTRVGKMTRDEMHVSFKATYPEN
jgi:hypothetical protein